MRHIVFLLLLGALAACDRGPGSDANSRRSAASEPIREYVRRQVFVGGKEAAPVIVVFEHSALVGATTVARRVALWQSAGEDWTPLLDLRWNDEPIRDPWRLVPHRSFRVLVDDDGEVEGLIGRGDAPRFRLASMGRIGEWGPDEPAHIRFQWAEWGLDADTLTGLFVDIRPDVEALEGNSAHTEVILTDGSDFHLLLKVSSELPGELWLQRKERAESMSGVHLTRGSPADSAVWHLDVRAGDLSGELHPSGMVLELSQTGIELDGEVGAVARERPALLQVVRGWIEFHGDRHSVFGLMRRMRS